jgi:hypothetical protein
VTPLEITLTPPRQPVSAAWIRDHERPWQQPAVQIRDQPPPPIHNQNQLGIDGHSRPSTDAGPASRVLTRAGYSTRDAVARCSILAVTFYRVSLAGDGFQHGSHPDELVEDQPDPVVVGFELRVRIRRALDESNETGQSGVDLDSLVGDPV